MTDATAVLVDSVLGSLLIFTVAVRTCHTDTVISGLSDEILYWFMIYQESGAGADSGLARLEASAEGRSTLAQ